MLRITKVVDSGSDVTLKLEGQLASEWVAEFERECRGALAEHRRVFLDLQDVTFVDLVGVRTIQALACVALHIVNCPTILLELIDPKLWS
jgi:anti-anti-sigma regulatory factor